MVEKKLMNSGPLRPKVQPSAPVCKNHRVKMVFALTTNSWHCPDKTCNIVVKPREEEDAFYTGKGPVRMEVLVDAEGNKKFILRTDNVAIDITMHVGGYQPGYMDGEKLPKDCGTTPFKMMHVPSRLLGMVNPDYKATRDKTREQMMGQ